LLGSESFFPVFGLISFEVYEIYANFKGGHFYCSFGERFSYSTSPAEYFYNIAKKSV
jgi:hypothetical protein